MTLTPTPATVLSQTKIYESLLAELDSDSTAQAPKATAPSLLNEALRIMVEQ